MCLDIPSFLASSLSNLFDKTSLLRYIGLCPSIGTVFFAVIFFTPTKQIAQYCIAYTVPKLDCSHNRVGRLASMGRRRSGGGVFAQVPLAMFKVRVCTVCDVYKFV